MTFYIQNIKNELHFTSLQGDEQPGGDCGSGGGERSSTQRTVACLIPCSCCPSVEVSNPNLLRVALPSLCMSRTAASAARERVKTVL